MSFIRKYFKRGRPQCSAQGEPDYCEPLRTLDYEAALAPLKVAIQHDDPVAMTAYGAMLVMGQGVEENYAEAAEWFMQAAVRGYTEGQLAIGACLAAGIGVCRNDEAAAYWLYMAGSKGQREAIDLLSTVVLRNESVVGKHFTYQAFYTLLKKARCPVGAIIH